VKLKILLVNDPLKAHEENFELSVFVKQGVAIERQNYAAVLHSLEGKLKHLQSDIEGFEISKVLRDEKDLIVESVLVSKNG
jgi:hypothetical protein